MPPIPTSGELWGSFLMPTEVDIDFLLPNGIIVSLNTGCDVTLIELKELVWQEARLQPLFHLLGDSDGYIFVGLTQDAEEEEFFDETRRLCDLRLLHLILKVVAPEGNSTENILNSEITQCIGMSVSDLNKIHDEEVVSFRRNLLTISRENMEQLKRSGREGVASYLASATIEETIVASVKNALKSITELLLTAWILDRTGPVGSFSTLGNTTEYSKFSIRVPKLTTVRRTLEEIFRKRFRSTSRQQQTDFEQIVAQMVDNHCLKVCCCNAYMMDLDKQLIHYQYIQDCLVKNVTPVLQPILRAQVTEECPAVEFVQPNYATANLPTSPHPASTSVYVWQAVDSMFSITIKCGQYVITKEASKLYVKVGVYHGNEALDVTKNTREMANTTPNWNETVNFNLALADIPRAARVCLGLVHKPERSKSKAEISMGWANLNIFDQNGVLLRGRQTVALWPAYDSGDNFLNPTGQVSPNMLSEAVRLVVEFCDYHHQLCYPPEEVVLDNAIKYNEQTPSSADTDNLYEIQLRISEVIQRDPLNDISEQEKDFLWNYRHICATLPDSLPQLVRSVKWNCRLLVSSFYYILESWQVMRTEVALHLLGSTFMDPYLRRVAVACLDKVLSDSDLGLYLLQLIQSLKFEPYLDNELTRFLLRRALSNPNIGLRLFWYLKAEMYQSAVRMRFGLILEAFCRGCGPLLKSLLRQSEALDKLCCVSDFIKKEKEEDQIRVFREKIKQREILDSIQRFVSPLNKAHFLGQLSVEHCEIKRSKKRPLWLVWGNEDAMAQNHINDYKLIFKHGDDLRQDMLTLQLIRIMDKIWKEEDMDMKLVPYGCLSTGFETGLIEAVRDAQTVMSIQRNKFKSAAQLDNSQLHKWIQECNPGAQYDAAIETFTRSCAGYCVATFVLGIRDRHPDNIMVNKYGQLFHIDFGHFLNNRKKKFGINRERVPFVLTEDFICVIARGGDKRSPLFKDFNELCGKAYLVLRRHAQLFLTLFSMMLSCGLPELSSLNDLEYLRKTLAVEMNDKEALDYFNTKFNEAHSGAWSTKMDWFSHWVNN